MNARRGQRNYTFEGYHPDDGLTDGQWVIRRGVWFWEANDSFGLHAVPDLPPNERVACRTCGATVTQTCVTRQGHRTKDHPTRETPRICPCGSDIGWKRRLCDTCRDERIRERKREAKKRQRERLEVAS